MVLYSNKTTETMHKKYTNWLCCCHGNIVTFVGFLGINFPQIRTFLRHKLINLLSKKKKHCLISRFTSVYRIAHASDMSPQSFMTSSGINKLPKIEKIRTFCLKICHFLESILQSKNRRQIRRAVSRDQLS